MAAATDLILVLNGGSSSIKFAVYAPGEPPQRQLHGHLDRIGLPGTQLTFSEATNAGPTTCPATAADPVAAAGFLLDWLAQHAVFADVGAIGHQPQRERHILPKPGVVGRGGLLRQRHCTLAYPHPARPSTSIHFIKREIGTAPGGAANQFENDHKYGYKARTASARNPAFH